MNTLRDYAFRFVGVPYKWAGNNFLQGVDCSGFAMELLKSCGFFSHRQDFNSQKIFDMLTNPQYGFITKAQLGAFCFYGKSMTKIIHVGFVLDSHRMLEAGGGDRSVITRMLAARKGAMVRIRPIEYRKDLITILMPKYPDWMDKQNVN